MNATFWCVRTHWLFLLSGTLLLGFLASAAQQSPATSSPHAIQLLQHALLAINKGAPITDITLTGSARRIVGSDDDSGTAVLTAIATGASRVELNLSSGRLIEIHNNAGASPVGSWSGSNGTAHAISFHNLLVDPAWFFPGFPLSHGLTSTYQAIYVGHEDHNGEAVEHVSISQTSPLAPPPNTPTVAHLSQMDFFLDATTFLPVAVAFDTHPDDDMLLDMPVEVRFSDYRLVNGAQIPFHVQKFLNNGLTLDLQFSSATLNSGISAASFTVGS